MKKIFTLLMICALMIVTGCGGNSSSEKKLSVMLGSNVVSLDSAQCTDAASFEVIADCIDGLIQLDADGKPIPAIAESFDVSADGKISAPDVDEWLPKVKVLVIELHDRMKRGCSYAFFKAMSKYQWYFTLRGENLIFIRESFIT